ncbi:hypothetical protein [Pseudoxanthomonas japonensis]|uniref:hypothetical protein n=1 Tax=Pseudoxanthomonas japonensis TaxID=69284 RepID=UPI001BCC3ECE|nr:hypothetical protein [Pseudoxanthomonas japonensis]
MATQSLSEQLYEKVADASAIADLMANCNTEHLAKETLANAGAALLRVLEGIDAVAGDVQALERQRGAA